MNEQPKKRAKVIPLHPTLDVVVLSHEELERGIWNLFVLVDDQPVIVDHVTLIDVDGLKLDYACAGISHVDVDGPLSSCIHCRKPTSYSRCTNLTRHAYTVLQKALNDNDLALDLLREAYAYDTLEELVEDGEELSKELTLVFHGRDEKNTFSLLETDGTTYMYVDTLEDNEETTPVIMRYNEQHDDMETALEMMRPEFLYAATRRIVDANPKPVDVSHLTVREIYHTYQKGTR